MHLRFHAEGTAWFMAAALGWALLACGGMERPAPVADVGVTDNLWLPDEAVLEKDTSHPVLIRNGRSVYNDGSAGVTFKVAIPCDVVARNLMEHFAQTEWRHGQRSGSTQGWLRRSAVAVSARAGE